MKSDLGSVWIDVIVSIDPNLNMIPVFDPSEFGIFERSKSTASSEMFPCFYQPVSSSGYEMFLMLTGSSQQR